MKTISIIKVKYLKDYTLLLNFSDGKEVQISFQDFLESAKHPDIKKYLDLKKFKSFTLDNGELMWGDFDLIFPIADLYKGDISGKKQEEKRKVS